MTVFTETYRGSVAAWECDQYGHMNVQFYVGRISDAAASTMLAAGMGQSALTERGLGIVAVNQNIDYVQELRAGALIRMESAIKSIEGRKVVFHHRLFDAETGALAMQADVLGLCFDLKARKTTPFPDDLAQGFARLLMDGTESQKPHQIVPQALPELEDGCLAGYRGPVNAWECDRMGHMNVQFYLGRAAEAVNHVFAALDLGATRLREDGLALRPHLHHLVFRREMREAAIGRVISGIRKVSPDRLTISHRLLNAETGEVSAQVESEVSLMRAADGEAVPLPDDALLRAEQLAAGFAGPETIKPQAGPKAPALVQPEMLITSRSMVDRWECDRNGIMATRFYMARFSDAVGNLVAGLGLNPMELHARDVGFAALDYRIVIEQPLRLGQAHSVCSGVLEIRDKTWRFCHLLLDSRTQAVIARAEVVSTTFDLKARKSISIPDDLRAAIAKRLIALPGAEAAAQ
ncbi:acyl-CoA thioesterase [Ferrovibrio sp.]|uniref:acyl-CoA thioesterase n=1 Tax=Ferrovibrio sp. TaxID=1917215 RepID=UPI0035AE14DD